MLGFDLGKRASVQSAMEMSALLIGALLWYLSNPMLMLGFLGCSSYVSHAVFRPLGCYSPACHLPFVKPHKLLAGEKLLGKSAGCCGKIPASLGSRGFYYFFLLWFPFPKFPPFDGILCCHASLEWTFA